MSAPFDFSVEDGLLNKYLDIDLLQDSNGNIPGDLLNIGFFRSYRFLRVIENTAELAAHNHRSALQKVKN